MKVYTKTGDGGTTALIGGERVSKADPRVEAYGTVDELAAQLALLADMMRGVRGFEVVVVGIDAIQRELMVVEAMLATGEGLNADGGFSYAENKVAPLSGDGIARLESEIDAMSAGLPPLEGFTIPGGHPVVSQCHVCRTVCRRAERATVRMSDQYPARPEAARYLNRLSDWLYVVGRKAVEILHVKEIYWMP